MCVCVWRGDECLSTGFVPVTIKPVAPWRGDLEAKLTGMTMERLGVTIRWQIARYDHAKSWQSARAVMPWHGDLLSDSASYDS